jgi:hyperosmotically inducible protein
MAASFGQVGLSRVRATTYGKMHAVSLLCIRRLMDGSQRYGVPDRTSQMPNMANLKGALMNIKLARSLVLAAALLLPVASFAADTSTDTTGEYLDDAGITTKVKASFAKDKWVKGRDISVRTDQGVVDLTGTVGNKKEAARATALATKVKSVKAVHNNLKVNPD